jgi:hypothetical protein
MIGSSALAHEVANEQNWHIHDGTVEVPLADDHHAGLGFWPLFSQEGLVYGTAEAPFVDCANATDKLFLPNDVHGAVDAAGHERGVHRPPPQRRRHARRLVNPDGPQWHIPVLQADDTELKAVGYAAGRQTAARGSRPKRQSTPADRCRDVLLRPRKPEQT